MDVRQAWQFPAAQAVLSLLSDSHSVPSTTPTALEHALSSCHDPLLAQIHVKLLRLPANSQRKWRASIARYINNHPKYFDEGIPTPLNDDAYDEFTPYERLILLHALAEAVLSQHPPDAPIHRLRPYPTGFDALRNQYWYFGDAQRIYREPGPVAQKKAKKNAKLAEQRLKIAEQDARRREREEKRGATERKRDEKRKREAEKWAPRVAAARSTRASRRLQQKAEQASQQYDEQQMPEKAEDEGSDDEERPDVVMDNSLLREMGFTSDEEEEDGDDDDGDDEDGKESPNKRKEQTEHEAPLRRSGRRRKSTQPPLSPPPPPAKRPRKKDPSPPPPPKRKEFTDPALRICTQWEVVSTNADELRALMERFGPRAELAPVERSLLKRFDEILPEMDEAESRVKRETDRKAKADFLMMNKKRSTRVQAITARREEEARLEAEREEKELVEELRIASHAHQVDAAIAFLVRDQSRDIRGVRREFGMDVVINRDEEAVRKHEREQVQHALPVRRSARMLRSKQNFGEEKELKRGVDATPIANDNAISDDVADGTAYGNGTVKNEVSAEAAIPDESVKPNVNGMGIGNESNADKRIEVESQKPAGRDQNENERMKSEPRGEAFELLDHTKEESGANDLEDRGTIIDSMDDATKSSSEAERSVDAGQKLSQFSSGRRDDYISPNFAWSTNAEDNLPMRVLDKFFFASRKNFADAPLEDCETSESDVVGFGLLIPPTSAAPDVERVEISRIVEWMFEYGSSPKIWVKSEHAWYELREPAVEYQKVFSTARRKFEICARVAIMGDTMRGPQLNYASILDYLSYPYGEMLAYKDDDVLTEKRYIVPQIESLKKRSLLQSGFIKELHKRIRAEDRKAAQERAKLQTREAALEMKREEEFASVREGDMGSKKQTKEQKMKENEVGGANPVGAVKQSEGTKANDSGGKKGETGKLISKKPPRRRSGKAVPRAVSSILNGILRTAMKSHKTPRKKKAKTDSGMKDGPVESPSNSKSNSEPKKNGSFGNGIGNGYHPSLQGRTNAHGAGHTGVSETRVASKQPESTTGGLGYKAHGVAGITQGNYQDKTKKSGKKTKREHPLASKMVGHGMSAFVALPRQQGMREKDRDL